MYGQKYFTLTVINDLLTIIAIKEYISTVSIIIVKLLLLKICLFIKMLPTFFMVITYYLLITL